MLKYFWSDGSAIPSEFYTPNFSAGHIAWVLSVLLFIPAAVRIYRTRPATARQRCLRALAVTALLCEVSQIVWQGVIGAFDVRYSLPLQLCSIAVFVEFAAVWRQRSLLLKEFSYALCMPAAFAAMVTPGWYFPFLSFGYLRAALMHTLLVLVPVLLVWGDGFRPDCRRLWQVSLLFAAMIAAALTANSFLKSNYMFLSFVPADTALVIFQTWFGNPGYMVPEFFVLLLIWAVLYVPRIVAGRRNSQRAV